MMASLMTFLSAHWISMLSGFAIYVINEIFAWKPEWKSNSILQFFVNILTKAKDSQTPAA